MIVPPDFFNIVTIPFIKRERCINIKERDLKKKTSYNVSYLINIFFKGYR